MMSLLEWQITRTVKIHPEERNRLENRKKIEVERVANYKDYIPQLQCDLLTGKVVGTET